MFEICKVCYECDHELVKQNGSVYGYWGNSTIEFIGLPKYQCSNCDDFYVDQDIAILTQEITRALIDLGKNIEIVDIRNSYELLSNHANEVYEVITNKKIFLIEVDNRVIINDKDVISVFGNDSILIAARKSDQLTDDVKKELRNLLDENNHV
jgi:hypothetical protein